jgi:hypothetical protein
LGDLDCAGVEVRGGRLERGESATGGRCEGIQAEAWKVIVRQNLEVRASGPGHRPRVIDSWATPPIWDGVVGPKYFVLGCVIDPLVAMEERVKAPGRMGARTDDRREVFGLTCCEAPQDAKDARVVVGPTKDDELRFSFVAFRVTALTYSELNGSIKWHPPFISVGNGAGEADLIAALAQPGEGDCGLLPKVKLEWAAR